MLICKECGSRIDIDYPIEGIVIECHRCGIELELINNNLRNLQLGPSEE